MKRYNITVNGNSYDVTVEETDGTAVPAAAAPKAAPVAKPAAAPKPAAPAGAQGAVKIVAPMPGTIVAIKANVGDTVKNGTPIAVLEAMKMENDIVASEDGVITSINVTKGQSVNTGDVIATASK